MCPAANVLHHSINRNGGCLDPFEHLHSHVHLTNCIHLKNHMHRRSPAMADKSFMRDLAALQRSRSLRDPSTSPPSWLSPVDDGVFEKSERTGAPGARRSLDAHWRSETGQASSRATPKITAERSGLRNSMYRIGDADMNNSGRNGRRNGIRSSLATSNGVPKEMVRKKAEVRDVSKQSVAISGRTRVKSKKPSRTCQNLSQIGVEKLSGKREQGGYSQCNGSKTAERSRSTSLRRLQASTGTRDNASIASNSFTHGSVKKRTNRKEGHAEDSEVEFSRAPSNGCGLPWNWSRIHHRSKTFLDIAGRSLSCGLADSGLVRSRENDLQNAGHTPDMPLMSDYISSSTYSESEDLPLLTEPLGSEERTYNFLPDNYSDDFGSSTIHRVTNETDSDLVSEARWGDHDKHVGRLHGRHLSLTQKYMPRTFKDIVGQSLVVQALTNAIMRKKIGLIYVFYGPHGTGKTSCARVFAKALNCQSLEQLRPCHVCKSCLSVNHGKNQNVVEVGIGSCLGLDGIVNIIEDMFILPVSSQYRVIIVDNCDVLATDSWSAISKSIVRAPRRTIFILTCTKLGNLPRTMMSNCQKFFFPKLKDSDIISVLQSLANSEDLEIDTDALKLIASLSDGSLRDAEMTLDQLSLLGQKISLPLVQELAGLVSDEKLLDLLDMALSADTVSTVKNVRAIIESGVEPTALMSQLATLITDLLGGSYTFRQEKHRKFFRHQNLSKEDMEKLRQALKTLSEAEKQLRVSNDQSTWLTAAMLQLAPEQQYILPTSSSDTSNNHSPLLPILGPSTTERLLSIDYGQPHMDAERAGKEADRTKNRNYRIKTRHFGKSLKLLGLSAEDCNNAGGCSCRGDQNNPLAIWNAVLDEIKPDALKQLMSQDGKLISLSLGAAPTVQLMFSSQVNKSIAEKFRADILHAFETILDAEVTLEIRYDPKKKFRPSNTFGSSSSTMNMQQGSIMNHRSLVLHTDACMGRMSEENIVKANGPAQVETLNHVPPIDKVENSEMTAARRVDHLLSRRQSLVKSKLSFAHVMQKADCTKWGVWSRSGAVPVAEKLEQDNLRLEPKSKSMLCWKACRINQDKLPRFRSRKQRSNSFWRLVTCGRCLSGGSPR